MFVSRTAASATADIELAAAHIATTIPLTGSVLPSGRMHSSGRLARYWYTSRTTINASPPTSGTSVTASRNEWVSSSEAP